jgi:hypothetical protein
MALCTVNPKEGRRRVLQGGRYGPGQIHEAEVTLQEFKYPCPAGEGPGWDRDCGEGEYALWNWKVVFDGKAYFVRAHTMGARTTTIVRSLGHPVEQTPDGLEQFDDTQLPGTKAIIDVKDPRPNSDPDRDPWPGDVTQVLGV